MAWVEIILVLERQKLVCFTSDEKVRTVVPEKVFHPQGFSVWEYELNQKTVLKMDFEEIPDNPWLFVFALWVEFRNPPRLTNAVVLLGL